MVDGIVKIATALFDMAGRAQSDQESRRQKVAVFFEEISRCLGEISKSLRDNKTPRRACSELWTYADQAGVKQTGRRDEGASVPLADVCGPELAKRLVYELRYLAEAKTGAIQELAMLQRSNFVYLPAEHQESDPRALLAASIAQLEDAAGKFKALAVQTASSS